MFDEAEINLAASWYDLSRPSELPPQGPHSQRAASMSAGRVARPWRRYLRLSVRGLIVLVLVIGGGLGWMVRQVAHPA